MNNHAYIALWLRFLSIIALAPVLLSITSCAEVAVKQSTAPVLEPLQPLVTFGSTHYTIDPTLSGIYFLVYRAGPLASFGHNHVIRAHNIHGDVYLNHDFVLSGFDLSLPLAQLQVDEPTDRDVEGDDFASKPSAAAIEGTMHNMLGPEVLDAAHFPYIHVHSVRLVGPDWEPEVTVRITLHGIEREIIIPISINKCGLQLTATGAFEIRQSDFGITPFSILGGGLQVADTVKVRFHIVAKQDKTLSN